MRRMPSMRLNEAGFKLDDSHAAILPSMNVSGAPICV